MLKQMDPMLYAIGSEYRRTTDPMLHEPLEDYKRTTDPMLYEPLEVSEGGLYFKATEDL